METAGSARPLDRDGGGRGVALGTLSVAGAFAAMAIGAILALGSLVTGGAANSHQATSIKQLPAVAAPSAAVQQPTVQQPAAVVQPSAASCNVQGQASAAAGTNVGGVAVAARTVFVQDTFHRVVARGWGSAEMGGRYVISGAASRYAVDGAAGSQITRTRGTTAVSGLLVTPANFDVRVRVSFGQYSRAGGENRARIIARANTALDGRTYDYEFAISAPDGKRTLEAWVMRRVAKVDTAIGGDMDTGLTQQTGAWFWLRAQIWGTNPVHLRVKIWRAGNPEPAAWNVEAVDPNPPLQLQSGGHLLLSSYGNSGLPLKVRFDDLRASRLRMTGPQAG